ncbi:MerR family transcriptional regulator [Embleya sp. NPDC050493]|uniref:MerR family transcriptional regulator n=1 Tax=Embleya sp. NPDC050493 TaxID=3363989 RepID=UPI00379D4F21
MTDTPEDLTIGQVATRTGLSIDTLRFYEREGILANPVRRNPAGRRVYAEHDIAWLNMCMILRGSGMPIPAIRHYTELARAGEGTERARLAILREHQSRIAAQIDQLHKCLDLIGYKVGVYEDYLAGTETESEAATEGETPATPRAQIESEAATETETEATTGTGTETTTPTTTATEAALPDTRTACGPPTP